MLSRFISAPWIGITVERKTTSSRRADRPTTIAMNSGSFVASTWLKSIDVAVAPPTSSVVFVARSTAGRRSSRRVLTRSLVFVSCGEVVG
jgi:hypothetical protein